MEFYAAIALVVVTALNLFTAAILLRSTVYSRKQKLYQFGLIWIVPLIGALLCLFVLRDTFRQAEPASKGSGGIETPPGVGGNID